MEEIREKNAVLAEMRAALDKNLKTQQTTVDKTYKEVDSLKKMLREERKLKQSAFNKVDDLLSQVYEFEANGQCRSQTANGKRECVTSSISNCRGSDEVNLYPNIEHYTNLFDVTFFSFSINASCLHRDLLGVPCHNCQQFPNTQSTLYRHVGTNIPTAEISDTGAPNGKARSSPASKDGEFSAGNSF